MFNQVMLNQVSSIDYIKKVLDANVFNSFTNDSYLLGHSINVLNFSYMLGLEVGLDKDDLANLSLGALLHDVGKICISKETLIAPALTESQWSEIKTHPTRGSSLLCKNPDLRGIYPLVNFHHERYAGGGYPSGIKAKDLSIEVRIITIADSFDAMISKRPFKSSVPRSLINAQNELVNCSGTQFDPELVEIFSKIINDNTVEKILRLNEVGTYVDNYIAKSCSL